MSSPQPVQNTNATHHSAPHSFVPPRNFIPPTQHQAFQLPIPQAPQLPKKITYNLMIRNIPANVQDEYLFAEIKNTCNIKSFQVPRKPNNENRGKCFLELWNNSPADVENAKKKLRNVEILEQKLQVVDYVEKEVLQKIEEENNFHIDFAPVQVTEEELEKWFSQYGEVFSCELKESNEPKEGEKLKEKHKFGFISFKTEDGAKKLRALKEGSSEQIKVPFASTALTISEFRRKDERNKQLKVYANLDLFVQNDQTLSELIAQHQKDGKDESKALADFQADVEKRLIAYKAEFDQLYKSLGAPLKLSDVQPVQVIFDKGDSAAKRKQHIYAYLVFERTQTSDEAKTAEESKIDLFADYFLQKKNIFANLDQKNFKSKLSRSNDDEESAQIKLMGFKIKESEGPFAYLEKQIKEIDDKTEWKYMHISTVKDQNDKTATKVKIIFNKDQKNEALNISQKLKSLNIAESVSFQLKPKTHKKLYNAMYMDVFSVNINDDHIDLFKKAIETLKQEGEDIDRIVKKISFLRRKQKAGEDGEKKKERIMSIVEMFTKTGKNRVLKNYKAIFDSEVLTGHKNMFCIEEKASFMIMPYTELEDFIEFKNKFRNKSAPVNSQRSSGSNSGTGSEISNTHMNPTINFARQAQFNMYHSPNMFRPQFYNPHGFAPNQPSRYPHGSNRPFNPNNNRVNGNRGGQHNVLNNNSRGGAPTVRPTSLPNTVQIHSNVIDFNNVNVIQANLAEFMKLSQENQRNWLGRLVHVEVQQHVTKQEDQSLVPRITGMLIDLNVFSIDDIITLLKDQEELKERINEATELINNDAGNEAGN